MKRAAGRCGTEGGTAMEYTLKQAADAAGVSKSTIHRATKDGRLSKNAAGKIDASELARLYPESAKGGTGGTSRETSRGTVRDDHGTANETPENSLLAVKLEAAERLAEERERELHHRDVTISDLRHRLDKSEQKRDEVQTKLTALLTDQRKTPSQETTQRRGAHWGYWLALGLVAASVGALWLSVSGVVQIGQ